MRIWAHPEGISHIKQADMETTVFIVIIHTHMHTGNMDGLTIKCYCLTREMLKEGCLDKRQTRDV